MQDITFVHQQAYSIATSRERRQTRPPQRYTNLIVNASLVTRSIDLQEPASSLKADRWNDAKGDGVPDGSLTFFVI